MKAAFSLLWLLLSICVGLPASAWGGSGDVASVSLAGRNYVRLLDWARVNNLETRWLKRDETIQLTNRGVRLVFAMDSREAEINDLNVWLSYPVLLRNGSAYVSEADLKTAVKPILYPPRNSASAKIKTIVLDPGHGGKDPGNQDGSRQEKKYALLLAEELSDQLKHAGFKTSLTRTSDTLIDLPVRPDIARRRGADLFISLHWNSAGSGKNEVKGVETYCLTPEGASSTNAGGEVIGAGAKPGNLYNNKNMFLAYTIQRSLRKNLTVEDRGIRRARFAVLRTAEMPAVLIEGGFMSHPAESKHIYDPAYRKQMAKAIVEGVLAYRAQVEQPR